MPNGDYGIFILPLVSNKIIKHNTSISSSLLIRGQKLINEPKFELMFN